MEIGVFSDGTNIYIRPLQAYNYHDKALLMHIINVKNNEQCKKLVELFSQIEEIISG